MGTKRISQSAPASLKWDVPRAVCPAQVLVDGISVIESSLASSEAYLMPEIQTKLSALSASSSVYVETYAPDICHLTTLYSSVDDNEEQPMPVDGSNSGSEDKESPHLMSSLKSSFQQNKSCCEAILSIANDKDPI